MMALKYSIQINIQDIKKVTKILQKGCKNKEKKK